MPKKKNIEISGPFIGESYDAAALIILALQEKYFKSIFYKNFLFKNLDEKEIVNQINNFLIDRNRFIKTSIYLKNFSNRNILPWKDRLKIDENLIN